ncbi:AFL133Cp [Eremothecium gossypii ATCC 10895]|uniref:dolichyl-phosphate beta-glucosyltransferase n=1 Tax=Eremothecium gossypii (strain ATCC 10895 / CBS 109.51 / FGSC 9923 / NRRL Y-1056) TaxID=284811 RepID=Q755F6_EREGS|nr:AFL133Cp [Eremothecium gossypii ATCC 10895]AAS53241.2 AFL133Cp [Eremothecium gossypii ATCC 10895]
MYSLIGSLLLGGLLAAYTIVYLLSHSPRQAYPEELTYRTVGKDGVVAQHALESVLDEKAGTAGIELSVVVPSYNETGRIESMLQEAVDHLRKVHAGKWEILIVDDGSRDGTSEFCLELAQKLQLEREQMRVVKFTKNRGKGGAVRHGMLHIRGKYGLFADADGASRFSDVEKLLRAIKEGERIQPGNVSIGSRSHMVKTDAVVKRSFIRNFMMYGLHTLVYIFGIRTIGDTQCGFKLFDRKAVQAIFPHLHTEGWIFDVEILILAARKGMKISEIPISWHEVGGSKMVLVKDSINMAIDLVVIRLAYIFGIYGDKATH